MQEDAPVSMRFAWPWLFLPACLTLPMQAHAVNCSVSVVNVAFASYDVFTPTATNSTGTVKVNCSASATYAISLSAGAGTFASRVMLSGSYELNYNLYTTSRHLTIWGDGTSGTVTINGTGKRASHTVYGLIPALQNVPVGSYSDTVTVTVTF